MKKLTNLKYLYLGYFSFIDWTFLSDLKQLKEVHLDNRLIIRKLFEQMERFGRTDLKIFHNGLLLNGPEDRALNYELGFVDRNFFEHLPESHSRLTDKIPLLYGIHYKQIECVHPALAINVLNRFTNLKEITLDEPVQDIEQFLELLKTSLSNIVALNFYGCDQPQNLFDRLPEYCALQCLTIDKPLLDLAFLFRLENLLYLQLNFSIGAELARKVFEDLKFLLSFTFTHKNNINNRTSIQIDPRHRKQVVVLVDKTWTEFADLNSAIHFTLRNTEQRKRKAEELLE